MANLYTIAKIEKETDRIVGFLSPRAVRWVPPFSKKPRFKALKEIAEKKLESLNAMHQGDEKYYYKLMVYYHAR